MILTLPVEEIEHVIINWKSGSILLDKEAQGMAYINIMLNVSLIIDFVKNTDPPDQFIQITFRILTNYTTFKLLFKHHHHPYTHTSANQFPSFGGGV